jgi:hypothetical protein
MILQIRGYIRGRNPIHVANVTLRYIAGIAEWITVENDRTRKVGIHLEEG